MLLEEMSTVETENESVDSMEVVSVDELLDRISDDDALGSGEDSAPLQIEGTDIQTGILQSIETQINHPAMTTPFSSYTVLEGLLLLLLLFMFVASCWNVLKRGISWLN